MSGKVTMCLVRSYMSLVSGKVTHVSVYVKLLEGAYHASLSWPFMETVTFTLLNLLANDNHHSQTLEYETKYNAKVGSSWAYYSSSLILNFFMIQSRTLNE